MKNLAIDKGSKLLKALANSKRLEILYELLKQEHRVGDLEKLVKLSQSALSQHLAVLRNAEIVVTRRDAQVIFYHIKDEKVIKILNLLNDIYNKKAKIY